MTLLPEVETIGVEMKVRCLAASSTTPSEFRRAPPRVADVRAMRAGLDKTPVRRRPRLRVNRFSQNSRE